MPRRTAGAYRVTLLAKGRRYGVQYPGAACKFKAGDMYKQKRSWASTFDATGMNLLDTDPNLPLTAQPTVQLYQLGDNAAFGSAAYRDNSQAIAGDDFTASTNGKWDELKDWEAKDSSGWPGWVLMQRDATESELQVVQSRFTLPANPFIALSLWRGEPTRDHDRITYPACTQVRFGLVRDDYSQFSLVIPYGGEKAYLNAYNPVTAKYERMEPENSDLPAFEGMAKGSRVELSIICADGKIGIAFSRGKGGECKFTMFPLPERFIDGVDWSNTFGTPVEYQELCGPGPLVLHHNAGQFAFRWYPIYMPTAHLHYAGEVDVHYPLWAAPTGYKMTAANTWVFQQRVWDWTPGNVPEAVGSPISVTPFNNNGATNATGFSWYADWTPYQWDMQYTLGGEGGWTNTYTYATPLLYGVQCRADPYVYDFTTWPDDTDISADVLGLSVDHGEGGKIAQATLRLKNRAGTYRALAENQLVMIELGYTWSDGSSDFDAAATPYVFVGYVAAPGGMVQPGPQESFEVTLFDPLIRLRDMKAWGYEPDGQTMTAKAAVAWLAARGGFHADQMLLKGSDSAMSLGAPGLDGEQTNGRGGWDNDSLLPSFGADLLDVALEYCRKDDESLLYCWPEPLVGFMLYKTDGAPGTVITGDAHPYRANGDLYTLEEDADDTSGTKYHIYDLQVQSVGMDAEEYADTVAVRGVDPAGTPFVAYATEANRIVDPTNADWSGGWGHVYAEAREHCDNAAAAQVRAETVLAERKRRPKVATVTTDVIVLCKKGDRFKLTSAASSGPVYNANVKDMEFRVTSVRHDYAGPGAMPRMILTGRSLSATT